MNVSFGSIEFIIIMIPLESTLPGYPHRNFAKFVSIPFFLAGKIFDRLLFSSLKLWSKRLGTIIAGLVRL